MQIAPESGELASELASEHKAPIKQPRVGARRVKQTAVWAVEQRETTCAIDTGAELRHASARQQAADSSIFGLSAIHHHS